MKQNNTHTAINAMSLSIKSANLISRRPRADAFIWRQGEPRLNAALAALTALSTSACHIHKPFTKK